MSSWEIVALGFLALLIFGPERLPEMARTAGRTINKLRREANDTLDELKRASDYEELRKSADVSELREVAEDLKAEADSVRAEADSLVSAADARQSEKASTDAPAPFDPDAT